jgi:hypothetical protein
MSIETGTRIKVKVVIGEVMRQKIVQFLQRPVAKLLVIELLIFGVFGLLSFSIGFTYSTGLMLVGAGLWLIRFSGGSTAPNFSRGAFSYELQHQYLKDMKNPQHMQRRFEFMNDLLIIGAFPLVIGIILSLFRL